MDLSNQGAQLEDAQAELAACQLATSACAKEKASLHEAYLEASAKQFPPGASMRAGLCTWCDAVVREHCWAAAACHGTAGKEHQPECTREPPCWHTTACHPPAGLAEHETCAYS